MLEGSDDENEIPFSKHSGAVFSGSTCSSADSEEITNDPYEFGITPPQHNRFMKRAKEKRVGLEKKEKIRLQSKERAQKKYSTQNVSLVESDSDENGTATKRSTSKSFRNDRVYERDCKLNLDRSFSGYRMSSVHSEKHLKSVELVASRPDSPTESFQEPTASSEVECPKERLDFHAIFSSLIRAGRKETAVSDDEGGDKRGWHMLISDLLWLSLQAWHGQKSVEEQDNIIVLSRSKIEAQVLNLRNMRFEYKMCSTAKECERQVTEAMHVVKQILTEKMQIEMLYPCMKKLFLSQPVFSQKETESFFCVLTHWWNVSHSLALCLHLLAQQLHITDSENCFWPWVKSNDLLCQKITKSSEHSPHRIPSSCSSEDMNKLSPYRYFVERMLKKLNLRKTLMGIQDNIDPILKRVAEFMNMYDVAFGLPRLELIFLFLLRIPIDLVEDCLSFRLIQLPKEPSALSVRQLMEECKEMLCVGVKLKQIFLDTLSLVNLQVDLETFEISMKEMLEIYFSYMQTWICSLQELYDMSKLLKNALQEEWEFIKKVCPHIRGGEAEAGNRFCQLGSTLFLSISDFLNNGLDECINQLGDSGGIQDGRQTLIQFFRNIKELFHETRGRASKALSFAKMLKKDLEIAAEFTITVPREQMITRLHHTDHIKLSINHSNGYDIFIPETISNDTQLIMKLLNVTCGREDTSQLPQHADLGYLLLLCHDDSAGCSRQITWLGSISEVRPTAETTIALSHIEVKSLLLVVLQSLALESHRGHCLRMFNSCAVLSTESTSCHQGISSSLEEMKNEALSLREHVASSIAQVEDKLQLQLGTFSEEFLIQNGRNTIHQCFNFGFEYHSEVSRLVSGEMRERLAMPLIKFARQWMEFVEQRCEQGRGVRPRWANNGFEFLIVACDPKYLAVLSASQFEELKSRLNRFISHLIGVKSPPPDFSPPLKKSLGRIASLPDVSPASSLSRLVHSEPPTPSTAGCGHLERAMKAIIQLEVSRQTCLENLRSIGRVLDCNPVHDSVVSVRRANFAWQKGIKVGSGTFGKVFTAVNMGTGEMMAMKEIQFQPNDHKTIKAIADELKMFESMRHPRLVNYFGVEIYRSEMLIFMEYCEGGTIEAQSLQGLSEVQVRLYTSQIAEALQVLHDVGIVHRDIKGANIFLCKDGVKLGDFGCSVKLQQTMTMAGELNMAGTAAYMAPEVITRTHEVSGRAADVWSLGCVVIEMASGKRPWPECENTFMIMYKVGMGNTPKVPEQLSKEGIEFLGHCLQHEPTERWAIAQLRDHPFLKVHESELAAEFSA